MQTIADRVKAAYGAGKIGNMAAFGANHRDADVVLAEMTAEAVALIDGMATAGATPTDRDAATKARAKYGWIKALDGNVAPIEAALARLKARV